MWGDKISIGACSVISDNAYIDCHLGTLVIGDNTRILDGVKIWTHTHQWRPYSDEEIASDLTIGNNCVIGAYSLILPQCNRIGDNCIVGAGAVVTKDIPDGETWAGNPARKI